MSIWASNDVAGEDVNYQFNGDVVSYITGWSNHYPGYFPSQLAGDYGVNTLLDTETPAAISTAWIPPWCVPGHENQAEIDGLDVDTHLGPWLRLDIDMRDVNILTKDDHPFISEPTLHSVCLNETAVTALRDNLNEWLTRIKLHPKDTH